MIIIIINNDNNNDDDNVQLELSLKLKLSLIGMDTYLNNTNDCMLNLVKHTSKINVCILLLAMQKKYLINLSTDNISKNSSSPAEKAKQIKAQEKTKNINELKQGRKDKLLHGKYLIRASDPDVNSSLTHQWLASSGVKSENEGFIIAAQDQNLPTRNFKQTY